MPVDRQFIADYVRDRFNLNKAPVPEKKQDRIYDSLMKRIGAVKRKLNDRR